MKTIAYCSPLVPPEWIAAHGMRVQWLRLPKDRHRGISSARGGVCPFAGAVIDTAIGGTTADALILATTCDQMRYVAARLAQCVEVPTFLLNVPSTWQTAVAAELYRAEIHRLGAFLIRLGGKAPSESDLAQVMWEYDGARSVLRAARSCMSGRQFAEALAQARSEGKVTYRGHLRDQFAGIRLGLVGGPIPQSDYAIYDWVEQAGGYVVLDATESGERTLPASFDRDRTQLDPLGELCRAYFDHYPDPFRRPNEEFYEWLRRELEVRQVRGMIVRRYLWCDLWHGELQRLRECSRVPVVDIDVDDDEDSVISRTVARIEALLEMLR